jgi:glutamine---fructose-6-phosphate transaminase (isomerizing)
MPQSPTHMRSEILEIPEAIARLLENSEPALIEAAQALRTKNPAMIATIARGSSDHAASFLKYAIEITAGVPVASMAPSVASIYHADLQMGSAATIAISQSGASPDIIAMSDAARNGGALTLALTNNPQSPLAEASDFAIDLVAGPELSVAATKSFVSSIVAGLALLAHWQQDDGLKQALDDLPSWAQKALACDWEALTGAMDCGDMVRGELDQDGSLYILGRGPSFAIAHEAALKFKETCSIHAEAYSAAEVMHGPIALLENGFPILALCARDAAEAGFVDAANQLADFGASVFVTSGKASRNVSKNIPECARLPFIATGHPLTDALCLVIPFYVFVESYSRHLGFNPDQPPRLRKVTQTR